MTESSRGYRGARRFRPVSGRKGFTLIELILATAISALVIGILSACFSFALRVWESTQNQKPDLTFLVAELLKRQLAECDPTPIRFTGSTHPVFNGQSNSIAFVTAHSVKAISHGVPVVARYTYDPGSKVLHYSELPMDPYHSKSITQFLADNSSQKNETKIGSYVVDFPQFVLSYAGKESSEFSQAWEVGDDVPVEVLLRWQGQDSRIHAQILMVNAPFSIQIQKVQIPGAVGGGGLAND